jgi:hypothetical protein
MGNLAGRWRRLRASFSWHQAAAVAVVVVAAVLRCTNLDWDGYHAYHPDERNIITATERLGFDDIRLDPDSSLNPHFFAYGSLPLYLIKMTAAATGLDRAGGHIVVARGLSAFFGTLAVALTMVVGWTVWGRWAGLLSGTLLTLAVHHVQTAHFGTVDNMLTVLLLITVLGALRMVHGATWRSAAVTGLVIGAALATKMSALSFAALPLTACLLLVVVRGSGVGQAVARVALVALAALVASFALAPYQWLDPGSFAETIRYEKAVVDGSRDVFYTRQFAGTTPVLYQLGQAWRHTLGPPLALLCGLGSLIVIATTATGVWRELRQRWRDGGLRSLWRPGCPGRATVPPWGALLLLSWSVPYAAIVFSWWAKFIRYTIPLFPFVCLYAAAGTVWAWQRAASRPRLRVLLVAGVGFAILSSLVYTLAFSAMYRAPHPWTAVSRWFHEHVPAGSVVVSEFADQRLPISLGEGHDVPYRRLVIDVYSPDDADKAARTATVLSQADYFVIASKRGYGTVVRQRRYPMASSFYRQLFAGVLGFTLVESFDRLPRLGPLVWPDITAEETFRVFDHPTVRVFRNDARLTADQIRRLLLFPYFECARMTDDDLLHARAPSLAYTVPAIAAELASDSESPSKNAFEGGQGAAPGQFSEPRGIAVGPDGLIWVADTMNHRIQAVSPDGDPVRVVGGPGTEPGQFNQPSSVAVSEHWLFVADTWNWRVQALSLTSDDIVVFPHSFYGPRHVMVHDRELYVADTGNHRIVVCGLDGGLRRQWGQLGTAPGELNEPVGMTIVGQEIVVADTLNLRLQSFSTSGELRRTWPLYTDAEDRSNFTVEHHLVYHPTKRHLVVTDPRKHTVLLFAPDGTPRGELGGRYFYEPTGVAVAQDGTLYFTEILQHVVVQLPIGEQR